MTTIPRLALAMRAAEVLLLTAWVGGMWFAGLLAAPRLFAELPPQQAGDVAGTLFTLVFWLGLPAMAVSATRVYFERSAARPLRLEMAVLATMLLFALIIELLLHPLIAGMRESGERGALFGIAHGASSLLYLGNCLLGALLVVRRWRAAA